MSGQKLPSPKIFGLPERKLDWYAPCACSLLWCLTELREVKGKVLDIGCAAGQTTWTLAKQRPDMEFLGIDPMKEAIKIARKTCPGIKFKVASGEKLPFKDNFFDAVVSIAVLEHVADIKKTITEAFRVLKPGGLFLTITPQEKSRLTLHGLTGPRIWRLTARFFGHKDQYTAEDLVKFHQEAGFKVAKKNYSNFFFFQLIDILYLHLLFVLKKPASFSFGGYLATSPGSKKKWAISFLRNFISALINLENFLLGRTGWPGFLAHIIAVKFK